MDDAAAVVNEPVRGRTAELGMLRLSGLEQLLSGIHGRTPAPPIHFLTGLRPTEAGVGRATFVMPATPWLQGPAGFFPGGVLAFLADAPLGASVQTGLPVGKAITTSELSISYVRPASTRSGTLVGRGSVLHSGRSVALSQVQVEDGEGRFLAHATSRLVIVDVPVDESVPVPTAVPATSDTPDPYKRPHLGTVYDAATLDAVSGLELLNRYIDGALDPPPLGYLLDTGPVKADEGSVMWRLRASPWLCSPAPPLYGGALALLADLAINSAILTTLPAGTTYGTLDLKVQFVRPAWADGSDLLAHAHVTHRGRSIGIARAEIRNAEGKLAAIATGSAMLLANGIKQLQGGELTVPPADS